MTKTNAFRVILLLCLSVVGFLTWFVEANIGDFDEVWQRRALQAKNASLEAYHPNPYQIIHQFNKRVHEATTKNSTRRELKQKYWGPCMATNPIDQCWRCRDDWESDRKRLAECSIGFGHKATGGKDGPIYVVTDPSDHDLVNPKPGTLRHGVTREGPLWITFARDMFIRLNEELIVTSDKTIDGRGANVHISGGAGIMLQFVNNVIIHNLHIHDIYAGGGGMIRDSADHYGFRTRSDGDAISILGSTNIWVDHVSMWRCQDGLIDAISASTAITISNCHMAQQNDVMLLGASDSAKEDAVMQVTVAFNHFGEGLVQRMPRCRWGFVHVVNNDYTHWLMYAIGGTMHPTIISQGNRFRAPHDPNAKEVTKRNDSPQSVWRSWTWRSQGDLMLNGAFFVQSGDPQPSLPVDHHVIHAQPGSQVPTLTRFVGPITCEKGKPC